MRSLRHPRLPPHTLRTVVTSVDLDSGGRLIIHGADDDGAVTNADVELVDAQGNRWSATVLTLPEVGRFMETGRHRASANQVPTSECPTSSSLEIRTRTLSSTCLPNYIGRVSTEPT